MAAGANTKSDVGIRRMITSLGTPQYRNFEVNGAQTYAPTAGGYTYAGATYAKGAAIPFDAAGGTLYGKPSQLERDFNSGLLDPTS
jgi:hypothetical protein